MVQLAESRVIDDTRNYIRQITRSLAVAKFIQVTGELPRELLDAAAKTLFPSSSELLVNTARNSLLIQEELTEARIFLDKFVLMLNYLLLETKKALKPGDQALAAGSVVRLVRVISLIYSELFRALDYEPEKEVPVFDSRGCLALMLSSSGSSVSLQSPGSGIIVEASSDATREPQKLILRHLELTRALVDSELVNVRKSGIPEEYFVTLKHGDEEIIILVDDRELSRISERGKSNEITLLVRKHTKDAKSSETYIFKLKIFRE